MIISNNYNKAVVIKFYVKNLTNILKNVMHILFHHQFLNDIFKNKLFIIKMTLYQIKPPHYILESIKNYIPNVYYEYWFDTMNYDLLKNN